MKRRVLAIGIMLLGAAIGSAGWQQPAARTLADVRTLLIVTGAIVVIGGCLTFAASFGGRSWISLDWFVPFLRKKKKNEEHAPVSLLVRAAQSILPRRLFADRIKGKPGAVRKLLKRLGPSVLSSPFRRVVQAVCLTLFVWLFFVTCWPYSAQPDPPGRISANWQFIGVEQESGELRFTSDDADEWTKTIHQTLHVVDTSAFDLAEGYVGRFHVASVEGETRVLVPDDDAASTHLDSILTSTGPWSMHEVQPNRWPSHYADDLARKEMIPAETFLVIDPLVSLSTAIASRSWVWSLGSAAVILIVCVLIPRGFCGYLCPLGTLIDLFDWTIGKRVQRLRVPDTGWWVHIKYYLLAGTLGCAVMGVLVSGYVAAIPVITRGMLFIGEPIQSGATRGWHLVPAMNAGHFVSIAMFVVVLCLGFLKPRFWCKYVCPSGAVFSVGNLFRMTERKVEETCINCNKCVEICPFDAIKPDFTTRVTDCTLCQSCGGVCPTHAIKFVERWNLVDLKVENDPPTGDTAIGRRGFMSLAVGTAATALGTVAVTATTKAWGADLNIADADLPIRPPGSVPEDEFLEMCIRCGECFKACPNNVLQAEGFQQGLEGLWTPLVNADWAGCASSCNACGQVCPTGAIRALPLEEKKVARMGLAIVNESTCLPFAGSEDCDLCVKECDAAGYHAIEYMQVGTQVDDAGQPIEGTGYLAPVVLPDRCVGCGLCQTRCYAINVKERGVLSKSAIVIEAGTGKEDRLMSGSYVALRQAEAAARQSDASQETSSFFIPGEPSADSDDDPFGTATPSDAESAPDPFGLEP